MLADQPKGPIMYLALTYDHRLVDGREASIRCQVGQTKSAISPKSCKYYYNRHMGPKIIIW